MALSNTLFAGLSGLNVNQVKLNVVGNNIANVNTVAFKSSRAVFKPQFYVTDSGGSQPDDAFGGMNPSQRGLGAVVGGIEKNFSPGSIETTGRDTDMAIDGDGFFVVKSDEVKYTRDGTFKLNSKSELVTTGGDFVQGYGVDSNYNIVSGELTKIVIPIGTATITAQATREAHLEGNLNASGTVGTGASVLTSKQVLTTVGGAAAPTAATLLTDVASNTANTTPLFAAGQQLTLAASKGGRNFEPSPMFTVDATTTLGDLMNFFSQSLGINTTVPDDGNALTPTAGATLAADATDPNGVALNITGNLGADNLLKVDSFTVTAGPNSGSIPLSFSGATRDGTGAVASASSSIHTSFLVYDSLGVAINVGVTAVLESKATTGNTWRYFIESPSVNGAPVPVLSGSTGTLTFDNNGILREPSTVPISIDRTDVGSLQPLDLTLDFSAIKSLAVNNGGGSDLAMSQQDGCPVGQLSSFSVGADGKITGSFSNGVTRTLGQIAIAKFPNQQGLVDRGGNMFVEGANSGQAIITTPTAMGTGKIVGGALELSNVDLSEEFINLIIASTGFNAASRVISTSDQLLTALLNTSR